MRLSSTDTIRSTTQSHPLIDEAITSIHRRSNHTHWSIDEAITLNDRRSNHTHWSIKQSRYTNDEAIISNDQSSNRIIPSTKQSHHTIDDAIPLQDKRISLQIHIIVILQQSAKECSRFLVIFYCYAMLRNPAVSTLERSYTIQNGLSIYKSTIIFRR